MLEFEFRTISHKRCRLSCRCSFQLYILCQGTVLSAEDAIQAVEGKILSTLNPQHKPGGKHTIISKREDFHIDRDTSHLIPLEVCLSTIKWKLSTL